MCHEFGQSLLHFLVSAVFLRPLLYVVRRHTAAVLVEDTDDLLLSFSHDYCRHNFRLLLLYHGSLTLTVSRLATRPAHSLRKHTRTPPCLEANLFELAIPAVERLQT